MHIQTETMNNACTELLFNLQILMNVLLTPVDVVKPVITVKDHFTVTVIKDMNCLMIREHVQT